MSREAEMQAIVDKTGVPRAEIEDLESALTATLREGAKKAEKVDKKALAHLFASLATHYSLFYPQGYADWSAMVESGLSKRG